MKTDIKPGILFVLDSSPNEDVSAAFYNSYIKLLAEEFSKYVNISIFYPIISDRNSHYELKIDSSSSVQRFFTYIPSRFENMATSFSNPQMEVVFEKVLKEASFDAVHIFSLKNHSLNYPFISKRMNIPTILSVFDNHLLCPLIFMNRNDCSHEKCGACMKISNFVASPFTKIIKNLESLIKPKKNYNWYDQIGRYSCFYNRKPLCQVDSEIIKERQKTVCELVNFVDKFHFFSEKLYREAFESVIPENKVFFMDQGIDMSTLSDTRPLEITGHIKFGFVGDIIQEEGIEELVAAASIIKEAGFVNEIHVYGEIYENRDFFDILRKKSANLNIFFHGAVNPGRIHALLDTFDVLIIPSKWNRSDTFLLYNAVIRRKAVVVSPASIMSEKIRKSGRGIVLREITSSEIANAIMELETNRKKLYYYIRVIDDFKFVSIDDNIQELISIYMTITEKNFDQEKIILNKKLFRKKVERLRGTA